MIKVYCAGKIAKGDWRHDIAPIRCEVMDDGTVCSRDSDATDSEFMTLEWPIVRSKRDDFDYVGPYFISDDHGCAHGRNQHGVGARFVEAHQQRVFDLCLAAIRKSDLVFVWLDAKNAYGTIAEIGYAAGIKKPIFIAGSEELFDLWFVYRMATRVMISNAYRDTSIGDILHEITLNTMPYRDYLGTDHWIATREAALQRARYRCELCFSQQHLNVHHKTYAHRGAEQAQELIVLCRDCHAKFHDKMKE